MAGQTSRLEIPYPTGSDQVRDGDNAIRALAERVDKVVRFFKFTVPVTGGVGVLTINFGAPAFQTNPVVMATVNATDSSTNVYIAMIDSITTSGCRIVVRHYLNSSFSGNVPVGLIVMGDSNA